MRKKLIDTGVFVLAAVLAWAMAAWLSVAAEGRARDVLAKALAEHPWASVTVDGLYAKLSGQAPSEGARLAMLRAVAQVQAAVRLEDATTAAPAVVNADPDFRLEVMRDASLLSVIGLVPVAPGATLAEAEAQIDALASRLASAAPEVPLSRMLQAAAAPEPSGWDAAISYMVFVLSHVETGRVSAKPGRVTVEAVVADAAARQRLTEMLLAEKPAEVTLRLELAIPRPVLSPFPFVAEKGLEGVRVLSCAAETDEGRSLIQRALLQIGYGGPVACGLGLGAPSPRWPQVVAQGLVALGRLPAGRLTISDTEIRLEAPHNTDPALFDATVGRLEAALPEPFRVVAVLETAPTAEGEAPAAPAEAFFRALLRRDGQLVLSGRLPDVRMREAVAAYARARFGAQNVTLETRLDQSLPEGWGAHALAGLEALAELIEGELRLTPQQVRLTGVTDDPGAPQWTAQLLRGRLGTETDLVVDIQVDERVEIGRSVDECVAEVQGVQAERKITFRPGSAELDAASAEVLDRIAEILRGCGAIPLEIGGHTDSQGRAETNKALSEARAQAVLFALAERGVLTSAMRAVGYGAEQPIADNSTEEGREANRRITFALILREPEPVDLALLDPEDLARLEADLVIEVHPAQEDTIRPRPRPRR